MATALLEGEVTIMPNHPMPLPAKSPLAPAVQPSKRSFSTFEKERRESRSAARKHGKATERDVKPGSVGETAKAAEAAPAELAAGATEPADDERPTNPMRPSELENQREEGFKEPELMKDPSEDRE